MQSYIKSSLIEFCNQRPEEDFQKLWESSTNEFWQLIADTYIAVEPDDETEDMQKFVMEQLQTSFKKVKVSLNGKSYAYIYIFPDTSRDDIIRYACQQFLMTVEEFESQENRKFRYNIDNMIDWTIEDNSFITMKYGTITKAQSKTNNREKMKSEKCTEKKFRQKYGKIEVPENPDWNRLYEMMNVAKNPKKTFELGATVDAISRNPKEKNFTRYGYIVEHAKNNKGRLIELVIRPFELDYDDEIWIWNGTIAKGSWLKQDELLELKQEGKNASSTSYKDLKINSRAFTPKF